ncbi:hypothetical protein Pla175_10460 [Pirellulimonas nuda]|uniref:Uncharacterized protein n=1 Tax=Pirellulimonas nuda TaxID=2528009 RepID=A0A518D898_9BACT|nr:hypothetical protein [Pirellulimonas nuda]QDU87680.1 hypothetical protein Pla175_10460 [Pirellulimonas nuda]
MRWPAGAFLLLLHGVWLASATLAPQTLAAEPHSAMPGVAVSTALRGLDRPIGVAARPTAEGAGPNVLLMDAEGVARLTTEGPRRLIGALPEGYAAAPGCLLLIDADSLIVGVSSTDEGAAAGPALLVYDLPAEPGAGDVKPAQTIAIPGASTAAAPSALAENGRYLFVATSGGVVARARYSSGGVGALAPLLALGEPGARSAGFSNQGYLVLGLVGEAGVDLSFRRPMGTSPDEALRVATGLEEVSGMAYGLAGRPSDRQLYVLNPRSAEQGGGVYRIDANQQSGKMGCDAVLAAAIDRPTSLAFAGENVLYVTALGEEDGGGVLLRIEGEL